MTKTAVSCCSYLLFDGRTSYHCLRSKLEYFDADVGVTLLLQGEVVLDLEAKKALLGQMTEGKDRHD